MNYRAVDQVPIPPTYYYPAVPAEYCDIAFISQVVKFHHLSGFLRLYISHTKPTLRLNDGLRLTYANPEIVIFDTYLFKIDQSKFDGKLGKIWQEGKRLRWMNELNLVSDGFDFFAETKESQMKILKDFLKQSYNYVQKIKA